MRQVEWQMGRQVAPEAAALVQESFGQVAPRGAEVARAFYARLFRARPELRALLEADMERQGLRLMTALAMAVRSLRERPEHLLARLAQIGRAHASYGVQPEHYAVAAHALLAAFEDVLGAEWTPPTRAAWAEALELIGGALRAAAEEHFRLDIPIGLRS